MKQVRAMLACVVLNIDSLSGWSDGNEYSDRLGKRRCQHHHRGLISRGAIGCVYPSDIHITHLWNAMNDPPLDHKRSCVRVNAKVSELSIPWDPTLICLAHVSTKLNLI